MKRPSERLFYSFDDFCKDINFTNFNPSTIDGVNFVLKQIKSYFDSQLQFIGQYLNKIIPELEKKIEGLTQSSLLGAEDNKVFRDDKE